MTRLCHWLTKHGVLESPPPRNATDEARRQQIIQSARDARVRFIQQMKQMERELDPLRWRYRDDQRKERDQS